jgi:NtrC-family two-component system response regulator AlgB
MANILIVDDEPNIRNHLATFVRGLGHDVELAEDGATALGVLDGKPADVVFTDVRMAGMDGMALLQEIRRRRPDAVVVVMTAYATVSGAVEAMRAGAYDYLVTPFSLDTVGMLLSRVLEVSGLRRENRSLRNAVDEPAVLTSNNHRMQRVLDTARQVATSDATILLTGESGTGKNVLAAAIHRWSPRAAGPFVTIACTTLSEHLLESELFGHVKGAFTGAWRDKPGRLEAADGGTVFLDEVGELPPELQAKLLRFMEERRFERVGGNTVVDVDVRIITATNRDLETEAAAGRYRRDLFYRLNVVALWLPPLRERSGDLDALIAHALPLLAARHRRRIPTIEADAAAALRTYPWPGNVRELVNALEHSLVLARDGVIRVDDLPDALLAPPAPRSADALEDVERAHVRAVLAESATLEEAAARLGINVTTLWRKRRRWGLD